MLIVMKLSDELKFSYETQFFEYYNYLFWKDNSISFPVTP